MSWFYLALLAPFLYAIVNLLDDNLLSFVYESPYLATVSAGFFGALPLLSRLLIHAGNLPLKLALLSTGAGFLTICYYFFYFKGLESDSPSVVIALFSLATATIPLFAHFIVHERLTALEVTGFLIVLLGSLSLAITDFKRIEFSKALIPVIIASVFMETASITSKYAYQRADFYPVYLYFSLGIGVGGILFFFLKSGANRRGILKIKRRIKNLLPIFIFTEAVGVAAELTLNLAISRGPLSLVKVIEDIQPLFVLLITLLLYPLAPRYFREAGEGGVAKKLISILVIISGLAVIGLAAA